MARVGIIGTGLVGGALAQRFLATGREVWGFDIDHFRQKQLADVGGRPCESSLEVARGCERIVLSLPTSDVSAAVIGEIEDELCGKLVMDTTTGDPEQMEAIGRRLEALDAEYVDATIAGSSTMVHMKEVVVLLGGSPAAVARAEELLYAFASRWYHLGPIGSGARMKLVVNLVLGLNRAVLAEGLAFAKACGVDPAIALDVLKASPASSRVMDAKGQKMLDGDFHPEARLAQHHKDVCLILEAGRKCGATLPLTELHERLLATLIAAGEGGLDNSAILHAFAPGGLRSGEGNS